MTLSLSPSCGGAGRGGARPHGPPTPTALWGRLCPAYPARPDAHAHLFVIPRPCTPSALSARLMEQNELLVFPALVGRYFPGQWATRPASARRSRRGLVRWLITLMRAAALFPLVDEELLDEQDFEYDVDGENDATAEELPLYCYAIPVDGGYPYTWRRALYEGSLAGSPSEALLYVICGNPSRDDEEDGYADDDIDPVRDALARVERYLTWQGDRRLAARVRRLVRAARRTSRRYGHNRDKPGLLCGLDHAVLTDLGGVFAGRAGPLGGVPALATVMARSADNCFIDVDQTTWYEMGYEQQAWSLPHVAYLVAEAEEERALSALAYERALYPLRADPALFPALVTALEQTLERYRAHAAAHGEPDPAARPAVVRRVRLRRRRKRPR